MIISLRNLSQIVSNMAVLPGHELWINIPGMLGVDPSPAAVEPVAWTNDASSDEQHPVVTVARLHTACIAVVSFY